MSIHWNGKVCVLLLLLLVAVAGFGCGASHEEVPKNPDSLRADLIGKEWKLRNLFAREVDSDVPLTLKFNEDGTVQGFGGCNSLTGTYTLAGGSLTFGPLASTRKSCGPALDEQEYTYQTFLATIEKVMIEDGELMLVAPNQGEPMRFTLDDGGLFW